MTVRKRATIAESETMRGHSAVESRKEARMKKVAAEPYRDIDFSKAVRGPVTPAEPGKTKISIRLDNTVIEHF